MYLLFLFVFAALMENGAYSDEPHRFSLGPEVYSLKREREGGTHQRGVLYGGRFIYDYLACRQLYLGFETAYAKGTLKGHSGSGERLRSHFSDSMVEGRLGYTLHTHSGCCGCLTPFVGGGYFWENNHYTKPRIKPLHLRTRYGYFAVGCLSRLPLFSRIDLGLNATARFSMHGNCHISHDPDGNPITLKYEQKVNCRVVLPITYICEGADFCLAPFFEYRHYGKRNAFPFDFLDTRLKAYGVDFFCVFLF
jgi:hypothetical protein